MQFITSDFKKGFAKLKVNDKDDLWYLSQLIDRGDIIKGKTTRKIKIGEGENAKSVKKTLALTIAAETVELTEISLRINGKVKENFSVSKNLCSNFSLDKTKIILYNNSITIFISFL